MAGIIYKIAQNVDFTIRDFGANFNRGYDSQLGEGLGRSQGGGNARYRIMVGNSDEGQLALGCFLDNIRRAKSAIRGSGMYMEVYLAHYSTS